MKHANINDNAAKKTCISISPATIAKGREISQKLIGKRNLSAVITMLINQEYHKQNK